MTNKKPKFLFLYFAVAALAFACNWQFLQHPTLASMPHFEFDVASIIAGYHHNPAFLGGWNCWHGNWINEGAPGFRPLSSHLHWLQVWLGLNVGWVYAGWTTFALFVACCWGITGLAWRWTQSLWWAGLAGILCAGQRFLAGDREPGSWPAWFPMSDYLLCTMFLLAALIAFDYWLERQQKTARLERKWLLVVVVCVLASALSKEMGYVAPLMLAALAIFRSGSRKQMFSALIASALMLIGIGLLYLYRGQVIVNGTSYITLDRVWNKVWRNEITNVIQADQWWLLILALIVWSWLWIVWHGRIGQVEVPIARALTFGVLTLAFFFAGAVFFAPVAILQVTEQPLAILARIMGILALPWGAWLVANSRVGLSSWAILSLIYLPNLGRFHTPYFHYHLVVTLFLILHLLIVAQLAIGFLRRRLSQFTLPPKHALFPFRLPRPT